MKSVRHQGRSNCEQSVSEEHTTPISLDRCLPIGPPLQSQLSIVAFARETSEMNALSL
jgi:hypothetical protein